MPTMQKRTWCQRTFIWKVQKSKRILLKIWYTGIWRSILWKHYYWKTEADCKMYKRTKSEIMITYTYVYVYVVYAYICIYMCVYMYVCMFMWVYIYMCISVCMHIHICVFMFAYICICIYLFIYLLDHYLVYPSPSKTTWICKDRIVISYLVSVAALRIQIRNREPWPF